MTPVTALVSHAEPTVAPLTARRSKLGETIFRAMCTGAAGLVLAALGGILLVLLYGAWPAFNEFGLAFVWTEMWDPIDHKYGALTVVVGTLVTSIIAIAIAVPVSFGIAVFLTQLAPAWLKRPVGLAIELLAAIPSIIYGMWGIVFFVPLFRDHLQQPLAQLTEGLPVLGNIFAGPVFGISVAAAGIILAVMIIPFIASVMRDVFDATPPMLKESAAALGATRSEVVWHVLVPYARASLIGAILLGLGRALGETMAVTFVIGNSHVLSASLFQPGNSIASAIASEFSEATHPLQISALIGIGFLLFVLTFFVLAIARVMINRLHARSGGVNL
jgi:phosphate transport system permease protein